MSVDVQLFVEERERIALAQIAGEIDVPFQHVDKLVDDLVRHAARGREERALDYPVLDRNVPVVVPRHHAGREPVPAARELHGGDLVHLVVEPGELAARLAQKRDGLPGAKAPQLPPVAAGGEELLEIGLGKSDSIEDEVEGVAVADVEALHPFRRGRWIRLPHRPGGDGGGRPLGFAGCRDLGGGRSSGGAPGCVAVAGCRTFAQPGDGRTRGGRFRDRARWPDIEVVVIARDECGGTRAAVADDQLLQGAVFAPDDPHLVAGHERERERRPPSRLHHREQIAVRKARSFEQAGEGIAVLDPELGRFRAGRPPGGRERHESEQHEHQRSRPPWPDAWQEHRQESQFFEESCDTGILGAGE